MKDYIITYYLYPAENIEIRISAKTYEDAVIIAKTYRKDSFSVEEVEQ